MTLETFLKRILEHAPPPELSPAAAGKWIYAHHFVRRGNHSEIKNETSPILLSGRLRQACFSPDVWIEIAPDRQAENILYATYQGMCVCAHPDDWRTKRGRTEICIPRFVDGEDGWFRYTAGPLQSSPLWYPARLYIQTSPVGAELLIHECSKHAEEDGSFAVKVALDGQIYRERWDTCVIYFPKPKQGLIPPSLEPVIQTLKQASVLQHEAMPLVVEVIPGVGYAENPKGNESFGEHRCRLIAEGLCQCRPDASFEEKFEAVITVWRQAGLKPEEPWLSSHFAPHLGPKAGIE